MARVTIEDCLGQVGSNFQLVQVAAKRARQLARGANSHLPWKDHKSTVLALQEIAGGYVSSAVLNEVDLPLEPAAKLDLETLEGDIP